ncbi:MAG TPA: ATP-binding protein [Candidatus Cybelea sp.]|nr:ATP-binding protein [Candidatus Cybelea sp.]
MHARIVTRSQLSIRCPAQSQYVAPVRHALAGFLQALDFERQPLEDITTAAGEALANIVEHAYARCRKTTERYLELTAKLDREGRLRVVVSDGGSFVERRKLPGRGFGLRIIRAIAARLTIDTSDGTRVRMIFDRGS